VLQTVDDEHESHRRQAKISDRTIIAKAEVIRVELAARDEVGEGGIRIAGVVASDEQLIFPAPKVAFSPACGARKVVHRPETVRARPVDRERA